MRQVPSWTEYYMDMARLVATRSKDPSTQVGAVIVDSSGRIVSTGYNGFPPKVQDTEERWKRPQKYSRVVHAEMNAIGHAARRGTSLLGSTLYCTHFPCNKAGCARLIITAGISCVVAGKAPCGWDDDSEWSTSLFTEAGVAWVIYETDRDAEI